MTHGRWAARVALCLSLLCIRSAAADPPPERRLVADLRARGIRDARVLEAMGQVKRAAFVPAAERDRAYEDRPLSIGHGQTISQPYMVALMSELLGLKGDERVLEIGTGSGYQAAILAVLAREVYTVEIVPQLAASARLRLTREGYRNVHVKQGDGFHGWREYAPFDAIIVTAVAPRIPPALIAQLVEGGILVMPVGDPRGRQVLVRGVKRGTKLRTREVTEVRFVPMTGAGVRGGGERPRTREGLDRPREGVDRPREGDDRPPERRGPPRETLERPGDGGDAPPEDHDRRREGTDRPSESLERPSEGGGEGRPPGTLREEELPAPDVRDDESGTRLRPGARSRADRARRARDSGRRYASAAGGRVVGDCPRAAWRCVG